MSSTSRLAWDQIHRERVAAESFSNKPQLFRACAALTEHERKNYSLLRLINRAAEGMQARISRTDVMRNVERDKYGRTFPSDVPPEPNYPADCLEQEISNAIAREIGPPEHGGFYVPHRLRASGLDTKTNAAGQYLVSTGAAGHEVIDALVAQSKVLSLGGMVISGLRGGEFFPAESNITAASFVAENTGSDLAASDESFGSIALSPRMLSATSSYSRKLLATSSVALDAWMTSRLMRAHSMAIDRAAIVAGSATTPTGILGTANINLVVMGASGGVPTSAKIHEMIAAVGTSNADGVNNAFLSTPGIRQILSLVARFTGSGEPLWDGYSMAGYRAGVSSNVPSDLVKGSPPVTGLHAIIFGDFSSVLVGEFGLTEVVVDPYQLAKQGQLEITSYQTIAVAIRHAAAFAAITDAKLS